MTPELMRLAQRIALKSTLKHHKTGALLLDAGDVVSKGFSHVRQWNRGLYSTHAEIHAVIGLDRRTLVDEALVFCLTEAGHLGLGKPCFTCAVALWKTGITTVHYSDPKSSVGWSTLDMYDDVFPQLKRYKKKK